MCAFFRQEFLLPLYFYSDVKHWIFWCVVLKESIFALCLTTNDKAKKKEEVHSCFFTGKTICALIPSSNFPLFSCSCLDFNFRHVKKIVLVRVTFKHSFYLIMSARNEWVRWGGQESVISISTAFFMSLALCWSFNGASYYKSIQCSN